MEMRAFEERLRFESELRNEEKRRQMRKRIQKEFEEDEKKKSKKSKESKSRKSRRKANHLADLRTWTRARLTLSPPPPLLAQALKTAAAVKKTRN